ncbi:hypothetical protein L1887_02899 [Cichorium endivia]|nr:hypothetical protein L1887_02899 [Cichorium endivia]
MKATGHESITTLPHLVGFRPQNPHKQKALGSACASPLWNPMSTRSSSSAAIAPSPAQPPCCRRPSSSSPKPQQAAPHSSGAHPPEYPSREPLPTH